MELKINNSVPLDLSSDTKVVIDYQIFSDKAQNLVSTLTGLDLPSTDKNIAAVDVTSKQDAELSSEFGRSFLGKIKADSQSFNSVSDVINMTFFERLKNIFDEMDIDIGSIGNEETFDWNFEFGGSVPLAPFGDRWFLTAGDFNGFSDNGEDMEDIPLYPAKTISYINQMFWTLDLYSLITKIFNYYQISHNIISTDIVFGTTKLSELYVFVPVTKFVCTDRELSNRDVKLRISNSFKTYIDENTNNNGESNFFIIYDGIEQSKILMDDDRFETLAIVGTSDTNYNIVVSGSTGFVAWQQLDIYGGYTKLPVLPNQGTIDAVHEVLMNDSIIKTINLGEIYDGTSDFFQFNGAFVIPNNTINTDFVCADDITMRINMKFNSYRFYDNADGSEVEDDLKFLNGVYTMDELITICENVYVPQIRSIVIPSDIQYITLTAQDQLVPIKREFQYSDDVIEDEIDVDLSLSHTKIKVKDLLEDIVKRYTLGYWIDSNNKLNMSNINNRYKTDTPVSLYESSDEPYTVNYKIDMIDTFEYKNSVGGIVTLNIENDKEYKIGDVRETEINDGSEEVKIALNSSVGVSQIYGDSIDAEDKSLLEINSNYFFWGYSNNEQLLPSEIPIMHGYLSNNATMNIRLSYVKAFNLGTDEDADWQAITAYTSNGNKTDTKVNFNKPSIAYPIHTDFSGRTILLGDTNADLNTSSKLYENFEYMLADDQSTITIEGLLNHSEVDLLLDGNIGQINGILSGIANYIVLNIEGFIFDQEKSVVKLKIKKYVRYI